MPVFARVDAPNTLPFFAVVVEVEAPKTEPLLVLVPPTPGGQFCGAETNNACDGKPLAEAYTESSALNE